MYAAYTVHICSWVLISPSLAVADVVVFAGCLVNWAVVSSCQSDIHQFAVSFLFLGRWRTRTFNVWNPVQTFQVNSLFYFCQEKERKKNYRFALQHTFLSWRCKRTYVFSGPVLARRDSVQLWRWEFRINSHQSWHNVPCEKRIRKNIVSTASQRWIWQSW